MANRIKAINEYGPRIVLGKRVGTGELVDYIAGYTGLSEGTIRQMLLELRDALTFFNLQGQPVTLEGLGIYTPKINLDGTLGIGHRADKQIKNRLNAPGAFRGAIENRENIGKTSEELVSLWNANHPDDPISA
jgi:hypothetical protein